MTPFQGGRVGLDFDSKVRSGTLATAGLAGGSASLIGIGQSGVVPITRDTAQLDHKQSWAGEIVPMLHAKAEELNNGAPWQAWMKDYYAKEGGKYVPTMHAARMYYNHADNLMPMTGGANASKGDRHVAQAKQPHPQTGHIMLQLHDTFNEAMEKMRDLDPSELHAHLTALAGEMQRVATIHPEDYPSSDAGMSDNP
jgi:hypothetical protein